MKKTIYSKAKRKSVNYNASYKINKSQERTFYFLFAGFFVFVALGIVSFFKSILLGILSILLALSFFAGIFIYAFKIAKDNPDTPITKTTSNIDYTYNAIKNETIDNSSSESHSVFINDKSND